ncbi:LANO_0F15390g1_1 [Lachancea nothofagi CBS 11611]|uniref:LANO_0F15390g1_1 n=1 Tax=Lachancea nothofagi CBS 11611 TaxID=1266666 RepID=A0A1G4KCW5_9SACH|nr:LANO_0F15390g1_1 [Lachancea nothofagi CBS 11611]
MRTRLQKHSRRLVTLLLVAVVVELLYVATSIYLVDDDDGRLLGGSSLTSWFSFNPLGALTYRADPNRMLPGLVSGSRLRLPDKLLASVLPENPESGALRAPTARDLVEFYRMWKFDTAVRYVIPCTASQTFFGRLQSPIKSLQDLFPRHDIEAEAIPSLPSTNFTLNSQFPLRTYNYDPRVATSVYYDELLDLVLQQGGVKFHENKITHQKYPSFSNISLPFNWYDWTDSQVLNGFIDLPQSDKPKCDEVVRKYYISEKVIEYERKFGYKLFEQDRVKGLGASKFQSTSNLAGKEPYVPPEDYCDNEPYNVLMPGFKSRAPLNFSRPELYALQARATLYSSMESPNSITFLNRNGSAIQVSIHNIEPIDSQGKPQNILFNGLLERYLERNVPAYPKIPNQDIEFKNIEKFKDLKQELFNSQLKSDSKAHSSASSSSSSLSSSSTTSSDVSAETPDLTPEMPYFIELTEDDFEFDAKAKISQLEALPKRSRHQDSYMESLKCSINTLTMDLNKYFSEASHVADYVHMGHHFDARFFRGSVEHSEMRTRLDAIVRAWLNFVHSNGLSSWLSHGTLYGWLYNGMAFPWDGDHDMQMPIVHLNILAEKFNQSLIVEDPEIGNGRFFLDVTNSITSRTHGNGNNNIDARFIDVDSGLYVDITGLSVSSDGVNSRYKEQADGILKSNVTGGSLEYFRDPNIVKGVTDLSPQEVLLEERKRGNVTFPRMNHINWFAGLVNGVQNGHEKETPENRYNVNKHIKVYNCRNNHFSNLTELSPLRLTFFHGAKAYVPNKSIELLKHEYHVPASYSYLEFADRAFVPDFRTWLDKSTLKKIAQGPGSPTLVDTEHLKELSYQETAALFQNAAVLADSDVEKIFNFMWNTFHMSIFRHKELELMYDESLVADDKTKALKEYVRDRSFTGGYKDPFQERLETVVWYNLLDRSLVSYPRLDEELKKLNLENADRLSELNSLSVQREYPWATEAGYQHPPSMFDFNHRGNRFFATGEKSANQVFGSDPKDLVTV